MPRRRTRSRREAASILIKKSVVNLVTLVGTTLPRIAAPLFRDVIWRAPASDRTAYLTFDDGPNPELTERIMTILERYDARGSFFLLGEKVERDPALVRALRDRGHTIGNHTYSHPDAWRSSRETVLEELDRTTSALEDVTSCAVGWMRPPYGRFTPAMRSWCRQNGQRLTMWDLGVGDYLDNVSDVDIERHVRAYLRPGSVIVLHDNPSCADVTPLALERLLERLTAEGWRFAGLSSAHGGS